MPAPASSDGVAAHEAAGADRWLAEQVNDPHDAGLRRSRLRRRALVVSTVIMIAASGAFFATGIEYWPLLTLLPLAAQYAALNLATRGLFELRTAALDERQRATRDAAFRTAFKGLGPLALVTLTAGAFAVDSSRPGPWLAGLAVVALFTGFLLPRMIAVWTAPDEDIDDVGVGTAKGSLLRQLACSLPPVRASGGSALWLRLAGMAAAGALVGFVIATLTEGGL